MDKQFILNHLKIEHLKDNRTLYEIAETSGLDVIKDLLLDCEQMYIYVPKILSLPKLIEDCIEQNKSTMSEGELRRKLGLPQRTFEEILREQVKK